MSYISEELIDFLDVINTLSGGDCPPPTQPQLDVSTSKEERIVLQTLKDVISWAVTQESLSTVSIHLLVCSYVRVDRTLMFSFGFRSSNP